MYQDVAGSVRIQTGHVFGNADLNSNESSYRERIQLRGEN